MKRYIRYVAVILITIMFAQINCFAQSEDDNQKTTEISKEDDMRLFTSENKVWETVCMIYDDIRKIYYRAFRGTAEFNGKTYSRLCYIAEANGKFTRDYYDPMAFDAKPRLIIRDLKIYDEPSGEIFLRQEGSKVYMLDEKKELLELFPRESYPELYEYDGDEHEILAFDFNFKEGDTWNVSYEWSWETFTTIKVKGVETENVDGVECRKLKCETMLNPIYESYEPEFGDIVSIVEGLGIVSGGGSFYRISISPQCDGWHSRSFLNNIYDLNGNILEAGYEVTTSGVDRIYSDTAIDLYHENGVVYAESEGNEEITLRVYSADGSVVASASGTGNVEYPLTGLHKGVYIVKAVAGNSAGKTIRVMI